MKVKFQFIEEAGEKIIKTFFNLLTGNLSNLKNNKFKVIELDDIGNSELLCKLALILFMLNKKIESKL